MAGTPLAGIELCVHVAGELDLILFSQPACFDTGSYLLGDNQKGNAVRSRCLVIIAQLYNPQPLTLVLRKNESTVRLELK